MGFLQNLIDKINHFLEFLFEKIKNSIPHFVYDGIHFIKHLPFFIVNKIKEFTPKFKLVLQKIVGYFLHYITFLRGSITALFIFFRSEEFKKNKKEYLINRPFKFIIQNPLTFSAISLLVIIFLGSTLIIGKNVNKIVSGTRSNRMPASIVTENVKEQNVFEMKHHNFEVLAPAEGGHGAGAAHAEEIIAGDIKFHLQNSHQVELMEDMEEMVDDYIEAIEIKAPILPLPELDKKNLENTIKTELNQGFKLFTNQMPIESVELDFHVHPRAEYYRMTERTYSLQNVDLQVFEEDLNRNHQVYIDFTVVASNRNIVLFLKDHEMLIRDRLSTNVEPILPRLPVEDEGKRIIKDKIKDELNEILKKENIEGKILQVYLDFSMTS